MSSPRCSISIVVVAAMALAGVAWPVTDERGAAAEPVPVAKEITQGELRTMAADGTVVRFPLQHTDVHADITGVVAHVEVVQTFGNPYDRPIEAVYVFPLPNRAALDGMEIRLEDRVIRGVIARRETARALYEAARREGRTAALLDQQRPNIFTQSVANILPGDTIEVHIRYFETLPYREGRQEFVFPMVVGPRFIPGTPIRPGDGGGDPDTTDVPDASRITPPVLRAEQRSGHDIALELRLDAGVRESGVASPSHRVEVDRESGGVVRVRLSPDDSIPNRDFVLRYGLDGAEPNVIVLPHRTPDASAPGYFLALLRPEAEPPPSAVSPKEMIFVVDCSGSMSGEPIARVREAMTYALQNLGPLDNFQIIRFSDGAAAFAPAPVPATPSYIARALEYVGGLSGSGGTIMLEGVKTALGYPEDPQRLRIVAFMTDGYIGNEDQILAYMHEHLGTARLHSFGVGSSVNRSLLDSMAEFGRGSAWYITLREGAEGAVRDFYDRISRPYLTDIAIDWGDLKVVDVYPRKIPDLFLGQPIRISGRYLEPGRGVLRVSARLGGRPWEGRFDVHLPDRHPDGDAIASLWARASIDDLSKRLIAGPDPALVEMVTTTALTHHLVSAYTSFVAVDERIRNAGAAPDRVDVPVLIPEGVDRDMAVGTGARLVDAVTASTTSTTTTLSSEFIDALPILGRNYQDVLTLAPGTSGHVSGSRDTGVVEMREKIRVTGGSGTTSGHNESRISGVVGGVLGGSPPEALSVAGPPRDMNPGVLKSLCRIETARSEYAATESIEITLTITNLSAEPLNVPMSLSINDGSARFQILDASGRPVPDPQVVCTNRPYRPLKPGETVTFRIALNEAGGCRLAAGETYSVVFLGSEYGLVDSNRLTIVVGGR